MKTYHWHIVAIALLLILAMTLDYQDQEECFTDSCVGCLDDCN